MATSSDLSAFGLRSSPFSKEIDDADLWPPGSKAALVAELSFAHVPSVLLLGEPGRARDDEEDDDGNLF
jgi:general secretion pathway protein A